MHNTSATPATARHALLLSPYASQLWAWRHDDTCHHFFVTIVVMENSTATPAVLLGHLTSLLTCLHRPLGSGSTESLSSGPHDPSCPSDTPDLQETMCGASPGRSMRSDDGSLLLPAVLCNQRRDQAIHLGHTTSRTFHGLDDFPQQRYNSPATASSLPFTLRRSQRHHTCVATCRHDATSDFGSVGLIHSTPGPNTNGEDPELPNHHHGCNNIATSPVAACFHALLKCHDSREMLPHRQP